MYVCMIKQNLVVFSYQRYALYALINGICFEETWVGNPFNLELVIVSGLALLEILNQWNYNQSNRGFVYNKKYNKKGKEIFSINLH